MEKINEKELKEISINMNNKTVDIKIEGIITVEFTMNKVQCRYNQRSGFLYINDKHKKFSVNTCMAYTLEKSENRQIIEINLDNDEDITIHII